MQSLSLKSKLIILVATLLLFCVAVGIVGYKSSQNIAKSYGKIEEVNLPNINSLFEGLVAMRTARIYIVELALPHQSEAFMKDMRERIEKSLADYEKEDKKYNDIPFGEGEEAIYKLAKDQNDLVKKDIAKALELHEKSAGKEGPSMEGMRQIVNVDIMAHGKAFRDEFAKLLAWHQTDIKQSSKVANEAKTSGIIWVIAGIVGALGLGGVLSLMVLKNIMAEQAATAALVGDLSKASENLAGAASNVLAISSNLSAAAEETSAQANTASVASEEVNAGVQTVASSMEEMVAAIKEITKTTNEAASMTNSAMIMAKNTNQIINQLGDSSMDIGNVIKVISSIAQQTNLLALNATIEAARAGEAGKGFAVVANEVKELAKQTAKATSEITKKIETIQADSKNAVDAIAEISKAIEKVNGYTGNIASSVEEQAATTNEVTRIVSESAEGVKQINENISQVSLAAANTGRDAGSAQVAAKGVGEIAELLKNYVARLKVS